MKQIIVTEEYLKIGKKRVEWNEIVGIRDLSTGFLHQLGSKFPRAEIFVKEGKVFVVPNKFQLHGCQLGKFENRYKDKHAEYFTLVKIISEKAINIKPSISNWMEWRLIVPTAILEFILIIFSLVSEKSFIEMTTIVIVGGIISLPIGWLWEHKARKQSWGNSGDHA